jgi:hypothetical protein
MLFLMRNLIKIFNNYGKNGSMGLKKSGALA